MDIDEPSTAQPDDEVMGEAGEERGEAFAEPRKQPNHRSEGSG